MLNHNQGSNATTGRPVTPDSVLPCFFHREMAIRKMERQTRWQWSVLESLTHVVVQLVPARS